MKSLKMKIVMTKNRILLSILLFVFNKYRINTAEMIKVIPQQSLWMSTLNTEETLLSQSQRVLERRYNINSKGTS